MIFLLEHLLGKTDYGSSIGVIITIIKGLYGHYTKKHRTTGI